MKILMVIIIFAVIIYFQVPPLAKKKLWGELAVYLVILSIGFTLSLLQMMDVKIPNPNDGITYIINSIKSFIT